MMDVMHNWIVRSFGFLVLCLLILVRSISTQTGSLSLACCAPSNFIDTNTINWTSDDAWFPDNKTCQKVTIGSTNYNAYDRVRVFNIDTGKRCYSLPTTEERDYLLRGTFLVGNPEGSLRSSFDVSLGTTPIKRVNSSEGSLEVEGIFRANNQQIDFCLVHHEGDPYISQLQLRPLEDSDYLKGKASNVLKVVSRVDAGSNAGAIRYPADPFDKIWRSPDPRTVSESEIFAVSTFYSITTTVPLKVLQTALTHEDRLEFRHDNLDPSDNNYTVILYFLELNQTKKGQRVFDIYINDHIQRENFDILAGGSNYSELVLSVTANRILNLTLMKHESRLPFGPLLNAYEILQVYQQVHETNQHDVNVMAKVRDELLHGNKDNDLLQSWSGDPCLPVAWTGLTCHPIKGSPAITSLDISARLLQGPFPASVTQLNYLKKLNLSFNDFTGKIPQFRASLLLTSVDLSHNDFTGLLPESLISLPRLTTLYYGCNRHLSQELPSNFSGSQLRTDSGSCTQQGSRSKTQGLVIGTIACGSFLFTLAIGILLVSFFRRKTSARGKFYGKGHTLTKNAVFSLPSIDDIVVNSITIQMFSLDFIENSTNKYKNLIGEGGFGSVYRGTLPDGQEVAVKVRSSTSTQGTREFDNELTLLSAIRHENLVPLLGYCCENDQQILVYPFMSNGSLQDRLYGEAAKRKILDWPTRLSIALGAARGLTHLHTFAGRCIIHRDVKSSNILLDQSMTAKVADFGFSKYAPQEGDSGASLEVRGTAGYLDPEYYSTQHLSAKSDVFSFGVVLLEIVSGREPLNIHRPRNEWSLVEWAKPFIRESKIDEIVDPNIKGGYHAEAMWRVVEVALSCIEPFSAYRPCMADIVRELEDALIIENNASEYMKSIDSIGGYSLGGSNRFSIVMDKKITLPPPPATPTPTEPSPISMQPLTPPGPR